MRITSRYCEEDEADMVVEYKAPRINIQVKKEGRSKGWWSFADEDLTIEDARAMRDLLTKAIKAAER